MSLRKTVPKDDLLRVDRGRGPEALSLPGAGSLELWAHLTQNGHPSFQGRIPHCQSQAGYAVNSTVILRLAGLAVGIQQRPKALTNIHGTHF